MNLFIGAFARDGVLLLTHQNNVRSLNIIEAAAKALGHELYTFAAIETLRLFLDGVTLIPLFDGPSYLCARRLYRYVHRSGKAAFPDWLPRGIKTAVVVYHNQDGNGCPCALEMAANFPSWAERAPRRQKPSNTGRWKDDYHFSGAEL